MKKNIYRIIKKYLSGRFSPETEERVQRWLIKDGDIEDKESASLEYWNNIELTPTPKTYSALDKVNKRIGYYSQEKTIKVPLYKKLSNIAAVLIPLLFLAGGYLYYQSTKSEMIEIYVTYSEEKHLFLPDSSEIWINSGSIIKYPKEFKGDKRIVQLDGEAYFSVRRDESKPFVVNTEKLSVNVLGTQFNVKAYSSEDKITTTLTSGKVEVKSEKQSQILKPNEQLSFDKKTSEIKIAKVLTNETDAWKSGYLIFVNTSLSEILQTLERKFNTSFDISKADIPDDKKYTIKFYHKEELDEILDIMQNVTNFNYSKKEGKIIITKK